MLMVLDVVTEWFGVDGYTIVGAGVKKDDGTLLMKNYAYYDCLMMYKQFSELDSIHNPSLIKRWFYDAERVKEKDRTNEDGGEGEGGDSNEIVGLDEMDNANAQMKHQVSSPYHYNAAMRA